MIFTAGQSPPLLTLPIIYTKKTSLGNVSSLQFYQNGTMLYNFSEADLISGKTIPQGKYDVKVYYGGSFKSVGWNTSDNGGSCISTTTSSPMSFTTDLRASSYLNVIVDTATCLL